MPKIWRKNCDHCGKYYESSAKRFCSTICSHNNWKGGKHTEETKNKIGLSHIGKIVSKETRKRQSITRKRIYRTGEAVIWSKGLTKKDDYRLALSALRRQSTILKENTFKGENNPGWKGGISKGLYASDWKRIRRIFKELKNFTCEVCGIKIIGKQCKLDVHHKDFNKLNNDLKNLIVLCRVCHRKVHPLIKKETMLNYQMEH